jgi:ribosome maturation factor RimP
VDIDFCVELNRFIEANFDREVEDYELEVGSAGLTSPFKVKRQYEKNLNNDVEVLEANGIKHEGVLVEVGDEMFAIEETKMIRKEGDKRKKPYTERVEFKYSEIKYTKYKFSIK